MRKKYHTLEELRGALAARQARWRERNRGYERVRARSNYEKSRGKGVVAAGEEDRGGGGEDAAGTGSEGEVPGGMFMARGIRGSGEAIGKGETHYVGIEGVDMAYEERSHQNRKSAGELGAVRANKEGPIEVSEEEAERTRATLAQLEILKERRARGGLNAGVEVELEI